MTCTNCTNQKLLDDNLGVIYGIVDPRYGVPRYVGFTTYKHKNKILCAACAIKKRFGRHMNESKSCKAKITQKLNWLRKLISLDIKPILITIEGNISIDREIYWIPIYRKMCEEAGTTLTNGTDGGDGRLNPSKEEREKLSLRMKNNKHGAGWKPSEETRQKMSGKNNPAFGKKPSDLMSPEKIELWKRHISESGKITQNKPEVKEAKSNRTKGINNYFYGKHLQPWNKGKNFVYSEEWRLHNSESHRGKKHSIEHKRKISETNKGKRHSERTKQLISEKLRAINAAKRGEQ